MSKMVIVVGPRTAAALGPARMERWGLAVRK